MSRNYPDIEFLEREYNEFMQETCKCTEDCDCQTFEEFEADYIRFMDRMAEMDAEDNAGCA